MHIRAETPADAAAIEALTIAAFAQSPHSNHTEQFIVRALRAAGVLTLSLVAEEEGSLVGHVALSPVSISDGSQGWHGLGPISVLPQLQRRGMGTRLMNEALSQLRASGAAGCVLLGEPDFYTRFGFAPHAALVLPGVPPAYFMALAFGSACACGSVRYHPAFEATA